MNMHERAAAHRYARMAIRYRPCRRLCVRCAFRRATGGFIRERVAMREQSRAFRASSSWWPIKDIPRSDGRTFRVRERPWEYDEYQKWKAGRS